MIRNILMLLLASAVVFGCHRSETSRDASGPGGAAPDFKMPEPTTYAHEFLFALNESTISAFVVEPSSGALTLGGRIPLTLNQAEPTGLAISPSGKHLYVTTYGAPGITSIFAFAIAPSNGALSAVPGSPFQVAVHARVSAITPSGKFLYLANEDEGLNKSSVSGFSIDADSGALRAVPGSPFDSGYCTRDVAIDRSSRFLYLAGCAIVPDRGAISVLSGFSINNNGALSPIAKSPFQVGQSELLEPPIAVTVHPSDRFVFAPDVHSSSIWVFNLDLGNGNLAPVAGSPFLVGFPNIPNQPGAIAIDPGGQFAYVVTYRGSADGVDNAGGLWGFKVDSGIGSLRPLAAMPYRTGDTPTNAIVEPSGKYIYVSNRQNDSVSAFKIDAGGTLTPVPGSPFRVIQEPGEYRWSGRELIDIAIAGVN
jgi:6-phosphogluconolactonase